MITQVHFVGSPHPSVRGGGVSVSFQRPSSVSNPSFSESNNRPSFSESNNNNSRSNQSIGTKRRFSRSTSYASSFQNTPRRDRDLDSGRSSNDSGIHPNAIISPRIILEENTTQISEDSNLTEIEREHRFSSNDHSLSPRRKSETSSFLGKFQDSLYLGKF